MYQPKLYLRFEPPIKNDTVGINQLDKILGLIENEYSDVYWFLGQSPTEFNPFTDTEGEDIADQVKCLTIGHWPDSPNLLTYGQWDDNDEDYQNAIDGWQWLKDRDVDYDETSDIFSSLNENEEEIPKLTYVFEPPIEDKETLRNVLYVIGLEHPGIMWPTNKPILNDSIYRDIFEDNEGYDFVNGLTIYPGKEHKNQNLTHNEPDIITWTSWVDPQNYSDYGPKVDGWQLVNKHSIPNTEDVFNQLNESVNGDIQVGDFIIVKDYQQLLKSLSSASHLQPDKKYKIIEVIPNFGVTFVNNAGLKHTLKFETIDKFFYVFKPNDFSGTESVFNQLSESTYQPKLNLRFEEPIYEADELDKVLRVLEMAYPGLQWKGGDSITTHNVIRDGAGDFEYDPIYYLTIGFFSHDPDTLTYTSAPDDDRDFADDEHYNYNWVDGWQWVKNNEVDYDKTSDIFNQLNESYDFLGQTNLIGFKFKKTIENNPKLWVIRTVMNDDGKELYFKYDFSDAAKELLGSPDIYGGNLPQYGDMPKEKVINLANNGDWEIIDMPTTETEDVFNQLNESKVNIPELNPETIFVFKPKIEDAETMKKILMTFQVYYPNLTWANNKKLVDYNPFNHEPETKDGVYYFGFTTDRQLKEVVMVWGSEEEYHSVYLSDCRRCGGIGYNEETGEDCELCDTTGVADFNNTGNYNGWDFVDRIDGLKTDTEKLFD